jgi:resuscitation-promoting factor RpfC
MAVASIAARSVAKTMVAVTISLHPGPALHGSQHVTVRVGDTLSSISKREYGRAADWAALWWANRHLVPDPGSIRIGQRLRVPDSHKVTARISRAALAASVGSPSTSGLPAPAAAAQPAQSYRAAPGSFQSCVIEAESGGNPSAVNPGTGAGGLYGFLPSSWHALGFSGLPENAPVSEQNAAFAKQYAESGTSAWAAFDGC